MLNFLNVLRKSVNVERIRNLWKVLKNEVNKERIIEFVNGKIVNPLFKALFSKIPDLPVFKKISDLFRTSSLCLCCFFWRGVFFGYILTFLILKGLGCIF